MNTTLIFRPWFGPICEFTLSLVWQKGRNKGDMIWAVLLGNAIEWMTVALYICMLRVHWLRPRTPDTGCPGAIPGQGTRSHIPKLRAHMLQWRSLMPQLRSGAAKKKKKKKPPKRKFLQWNVTPSVMVSEEGLGRWLGHEGGALMNVISALMKKRLQGTSHPSAVQGLSKKMAIYGPRSGSAPHTESAGALSWTS